MEFSREALRQGLKNQQASAETADSFATIEGASQPRVTSDLDKKSNRMAGPVGARALELMNDPMAANAVGQWMQRFGMSNQGMQWNQAKMMMSQPAPPPEG